MYMYVCMYVHMYVCMKGMYVCVCVYVCRRTLGYEDVLESLARKGIAIRVASPKLVMEEVSTYYH